MFNIVGKFVDDNNNIVAFQVVDDGLSYNIPVRAVYSEMFFDRMREEGYVFKDYHLNISTSDGFDIRDVKTVEYKLSSEELVELCDSIENCMYDEKDIAQYFQREVVHEVFSVLEGDNIRITTRQQFDDYLESQYRSFLVGTSIFYPHNLNKIVARDVLYKPNEVLSKIHEKEQKRYQNVFNGCTITTINQFRYWCELHGIDMSRDWRENVVQFLESYFSYGIPGMNCKIVRKEIIYRPEVSIDNPYQGVRDKGRLHYGVIDSNSTVYSKDGFGNKYELEMDTVMDTIGKIAGTMVNSKITSEGVILPTESVSDELDVVEYVSYDDIPRIKFGILTDDGLVVDIIANCDKIVILKDGVVAYPEMELFRYRTIDGFYLPISEILRRGEEYIKESVLTRLYVKDAVSKVTKEPEFGSTFELMCSAGVPPHRVPGAILKALEAGAFCETVPSTDVKTFVDDHWEAIKTYMNGFSEYILRKYGPVDDSDFLELPIEVQIEYINEEVSRLMETGSYMVPPVVPAGENQATYKPYLEYVKELNGNEVNNVNFVIDIMNGVFNLGEYAMGCVLDNYYDVNKISEIILGVYCRAKHVHPEWDIERFLTSEVDRIIDHQMVFKNRDNAYKGCIRDFLTYRSRYVYTSEQVCYVTKVFRENSNVKDESSYRHHSIELVTFEKAVGTEGFVLFKSLYESAKKAYDTMYGNGASKDVTTIAEAVMKAIMDVSVTANRSETIRMDTDFAYMKIKFTDTKLNLITLEVPMSKTYAEKVIKGYYVKTKYCSLYDWSEHCFDDVTHNCRWICLNANINPWYVEPFGGITIPEYNIFHNYYTNEVISYKLPKQFLDGIPAGCKVMPEMSDVFSGSNMYPVMSIYDNLSEERLDAIRGETLKYDVYESIDAYMFRTLEHINNARERNEAAISTELKSDVVYEAFRQYFDGEPAGTHPIDGVVYTRKNTNVHMSNYHVRMLTNGWKNNYLKLQDLSAKRVSFLEVDDLKFKDLVYNDDIIYQKFSLTPFKIIKGKFEYSGKVFDIASLTQSDIEEMVGDGVAVFAGAGRMIVRSNRGLIKVVL